MILCNCWNWPKWCSGTKSDEKQKFPKIFLNHVYKSAFLSEEIWMPLNICPREKYSIETVPTNFKDFIQNYFHSHKPEVTKGHYRLLRDKYVITGNPWNSHSSKWLTVSHSVVFHYHEFEPNKFLGFRSKMTFLVENHR